MNLIKRSRNRCPSLPAYVFTTLTLLFLFGQPRAALAQWATNGNHISNTNTGNVGIGTNSPNSKLGFSIDDMVEREKLHQKFHLLLLT